MEKRDFDEMISYFCQKVSEMNISRKCKMELLGMITAIEMKHDEMVPKWIPVSEALPEEEVTVLVSAHYDGDKCYDYKANDYVTTAEYMDDRWFLSDEEHIMQLHKHHVIAWMPLPEPYEVTDENASRNN